MTNTNTETFSLQHIEVNLPTIERIKWQQDSSLIIMPSVSQEIYFATWEFNFDQDKLKAIPNGIVLHRILREIIGKKTLQHQSQEIKRFFEEKGAHFYVGTTSQSLFLRLSCLAEYWEVCLEKVKEIIFEAAIDAKIWKRVRKKLLNRIADFTFDTDREAGQLLKEQLTDQQEIWNARMTADHVLSIQPDDLVKAYGLVMDLTRLNIYLGGHWKEEDKQLLENYFSKEEILKLNLENGTTFSELKYQSKPAKYKGEQYSLRWGLMLMSPKDENYPVAIMAAKALGGYFGSRLMQVLREQKGLTYGAYAFVAPYEHFSTFEIATDISKENLELTQALISEELMKLGTTLIPEQEWNTIKNNLIGDLLVSLDGPISLMNRIRALDARNLTPEEFSQQVTVIQNMKAETVRDFFKNHLKPSLFKRVWVG